MPIFSGIDERHLKTYAWFGSNSCTIISIVGDMKVCSHRLSGVRLEAGDTIVEVIIAVVIVSSILAGAFTVMNRSAQTVRDSEEHAQALQLLQGQVELLRNAASNRSTFPPNIDVGNAFCLVGTSYYPATQPQCLLGSPGLYQAAIWSPTSAHPNVGSTTTFFLTATWPSLSGQTNKVYLSYKVEIAP